MKSSEDPGSNLVRKSSILEPFSPPFCLLLGSFWRPFLGRVSGALFVRSLLVYRSQMGAHFASILAPFPLRFSMRFLHAL